MALGGTGLMVRMPTTGHEHNADLESSVGVWNGKPRHLVKVLLPLLLVAVGADEDDLQLVALLGARLDVELGELRSEAATRRAPVRAEVQACRFKRQSTH